VCSALAARGYRTILSVTAYDRSAEQRCIQMVQQNKVDGIIGLTYNPELEIDPRLPYVSIDRTFSSSVPCVASDNFGGGQLAAEKLLELGCTHPLFLRIGPRVPGESDKRGDGFESVFRQRGMECAALRLSDEDGLAPFRDFLAGHMGGGRLAETSVDMLLREDRSNLPSLVCLPVAYAPGGTTKE
jgi:LacI family transcriptional regulator